LGRNHWESVTEKYNAATKETRDIDSLRAKWNKLVNTPKPTGDPSCPKNVKDAKRIYQMIQATAGTQSLGVDTEQEEGADEKHESEKEDEDYEQIPTDNSLTRLFLPVEPTPGLTAPLASVPAQSQPTESLSQPAHRPQPAPAQTVPSKKRKLMQANQVESPAFGTRRRMDSSMDRIASAFEQSQANKTQDMVVQMLLQQQQMMMQFFLRSSVPPTATIAPTVASSMALSLPLPLPPLPEFE